MSEQPRRPQDWITQALTGFIAEFGDELTSEAKGALAARLVLACAAIQGDVETAPFMRAILPQSKDLP